MLRDEDFVSQIKKKIKDTILFDAKDKAKFDQNGCIVGECEFSINDQLFFLNFNDDYMRGSNIICLFAKKQNVNREKDLEKKIEELERKLIISDDKTLIFEEIDKSKLELEASRFKSNEGIAIRSRIKWMEFGEKPSKFFLNLEKQNNTNKEIRQLSAENGDILDRQSDILKEVFNFYSNLYAEKETDRINLEVLLNYPDIPKLSSQMSSLLEGPLCVDEIYSTLKIMKNNKSPGQDGFTVECYRYFWEDIKYLLVRSLNYAYFTGKLSNSQKMGIITLIPKGNKPRH